MALINVEKRTRTLVDDNWSVWTVTTDAPPYTNTTLIEYRAASDYNTYDPVTIDVTDLTAGASVDTTTGPEWQGTGVFDVIMQSVNGNIRVEHDNGRITGPEYAKTYLGGLQAALNVATQFLLRKATAEAQADQARFTAESSEFSLDNMLPLQRDKAQEEYDLMEDTHTSKVTLAQNQAAKLAADTSYIAEQEAQLINSVLYNNKIKALGSLADTYGTFGAGGLDLTPDMWTAYFEIIQLLTDVVPPTSTGASKVV